MECKEFREVIDDEILSDEILEDIFEHVKSCPHCDSILLQLGYEYLYSPLPAITIEEKEMFRQAKKRLTLHLKKMLCIEDEITIQPKKKVDIDPDKEIEMLKELEQWINEEFFDEGLKLG